MSRRARLLVICHANVARSVAAAALLVGSVDERGEPIEVRSAGTHAAEGQPASMRTASSLALAAGRDVALGGHRAHLVGAEDLEWADLVVAMEASQVRWIRRVHPEAGAKTASIATLAEDLPRGAVPLAERVAEMGLSSLEPPDRGDVVDPAGGDESVYRATMATLVALCEQLRGRLHG